MTTNWNLDIIYYKMETIIITPNFNIHLLFLRSLCVDGRTSQNLTDTQFTVAFLSKFTTEIS